MFSVAGNGAKVNLENYIGTFADDKYILGGFFTKKVLKQKYIQWSPAIGAIRH